MPISFSYLFHLIIFATSVYAGLYPTQPIANTVFVGGKYNNVTWIDNDMVSGTRLHELGELQIDLWVDNIKRIAILATGVDPQQMSQDVFIPRHIWHNAQNFVLRFKSQNPRKTIYTAEFSITNMTGNRTNRLDENLGQPLNPSAPIISIASSTSITPDGAKNDMVTVTMEMSDSSTTPGPSLPSEAITSMVNSASSGGRHVRRPSMQFNFVFVFFPAIFGLALAL